MSEQHDSTPADASEPARGVGGQLRARREELGLSVEQVSAQLKLGRRQIEAIEADHYESLPGNTFARGFVRNYAKLLKLDAAPLLEDLERLLPRERLQSALPAVKEEIRFSVGAGSANASSGSMAGVLVGVLTFAAVLGGVWWYLQQPVSPQLDVVPNQVTELSLPEIVSTSAPVAASQPASLPASAPAVTAPMAVTPTPVAAAVAGEELRFVAEGETWVQVFDASGQRVLSEVIPAGAERRVTGQRPFSIKIGNAPQTRLFHKGQAVDLAPHTKVNVATFELK